MIPKIIEAGNKTRLFTSWTVETEPNLSVEPDHLPRRSPFDRFYNKARKKVANEHDKNTFQIIENLQKVFGLDISYENSVPPIGAPNAALTPAEAPAATYYLLFSSFLKNSNPYLGI